MYVICCLFANAGCFWTDDHRTGLRIVLISSLEEHVIVPSSVVLRGAKYTKLWWLGWVVVSLLTLCVTFLCGWVLSYDFYKERADDMERKYNELAKLQENIWERQKSLLNTFVDAVNQEKDKEEIRRSNRGLVTERNIRR